MSLAELRALAETEDQPTDEQAELEIDEPETEVAEDEADAEASTDEEAEEESDDISFEMDEEPEQSKPSKADIFKFKLAKKTDQYQQSRDELEEQKRLNAELQAKLEAMQSGAPAQASQAPQPQPAQSLYGTPAPTPPDRYDAKYIGNEAAYAQDHAQYMSNWQMWAEAQKAPQVQAEQAQKQHAQMLEDWSNSLVKDAEAFVDSQNVKNKEAFAEKVGEGIAAVRDVVDTLPVRQSDGSVAPIPGAMLYLMDKVGEGATKAAYILSKRPDKLETLKRLLSDDPTGGRAISFLTDLKHVKTSKTVLSKAPEPDEPIKGDANSVSATRLQSMYDKETDPTKMLKLRQQARKMGVALN